MPTIALIQGLYYLVTGLWPVFNMRSFEKLSGHKTDKWLVKMVGLLAAAVGVSLLVYGTEPEVRLIAVLAAISFTLIDVLYVFKGRISKVYLVDALFQAAFIAGWFLR